MKTKLTTTLFAAFVVLTASGSALAGTVAADKPAAEEPFDCSITLEYESPEDTVDKTVYLVTCTAEEATEAPVQASASEGEPDCSITLEYESPEDTVDKTTYLVTCTAEEATGGLV